MSQRHLGPRLFGAIRRFGSADEGNVAILFGMGCVPAMLLIGAAVDYTNASARKASLQAAVDAATLAAVQLPVGERAQTIDRILRANLDPSIRDVQIGLQDSSKGATVTARVQWPTAVMRLAGVSDVTINASATARMGRRDTSCILTLGRNIPVAEDALTFNGSPSVSLTACGMMSNASVTCSGGSTNAPFTAAAGSVSGACPNQKPDQEPIPDVYAPLQKQVQSLCSGLRRTTTWRAGDALPLPNMIPVTRSGYVEYHVCGDLRLEGSGELNTLPFAQDAVIVIENGDLDVRMGANLSAMRTTFVLTGEDLYSHRVVFPNGAGNGATLALSPSVSADNPWRGVSIFQDPRLAANVDMTWSPAATLRADGVLYFGPAALKLNGNASSNAAACTKLVANSLTVNGNIAFEYKKDSPVCGSLGVAQFESPPHLTP